MYFAVGLERAIGTFEFRIVRLLMHLQRSVVLALKTAYVTQVYPILGVNLMTSPMFH